ncbi:MAG: hypothetical protein FJ102_03315 [Deltaproteobacteria bacterium]|nr:hypothetical protein [Deltaproteobacteria bacterium]
MRPVPPLPAQLDHASLRAWIDTFDPALARAADEVDGSLVAWALSLTPRERLDRATATGTWLARARRVAT